MGPEHVWLDRHGSVHLSPGVVPSVADIAALLEGLLTAVRRQQGSQLPPGLVLIAARATGRIDAAPIVSLTALATALGRFDSPDPRATLRDLFATAEELTGTSLVSNQGTEQPAIAEARAHEVANYEYQSGPVTDPLIDRRPAGLQRGRHGLLRSAGTAAAIAGLAAGVAAAIVLQVPRRGADRVKDATDVVVARPSPIGQTPGASISQAAPRAGMNAPEGPASPAPSPAVSNLPHDRGSAPPPASADVDRLPERTDVAEGVRATRQPQPLVDRDQVDADAIFSPSFAANGTALFFQAETAAGSALKRAERGERGVLHVATVVDDGAKNYHVQLSPDGRWVAFDSDRDGVRGVYVARADGSAVRRVSGNGYAAVPTWSPDGQNLAFLRGEVDRPNVWNLWLLELASGQLTRLTNHRYGQVWAGAWFPDGRRIAYSHEDRLILLDLDSRRSTRYVSPRRGRLVRTPAVSPDGRWIVFQVFRDGGWLLDLESGSMQRVLDDPSAEEFTWAPDGRRVAFHSRRSGEWGLWMMAAR